ncbi:ABC transporter ATP-binding protein [Aliikangiella coralliicola]|uniref:ATP-binding cassette domain-containing protein n=1 Tax=Aliikangiella coralliicola TaxID=2592383 RepID=A0A545UAY6_9GAMM|nr:ATP-binding cassette domain-containing protein [Aliikangiella coralliicola]TQV86593.1 ATP-binding cassette domain-containing protein [Aliikangiella coralliicola]
MLEVKNLMKRFRLDNKTIKENKKKSKEMLDRREQGHWFNAVVDVSFSCESGEVLGLLGPNGAGKTTSLRMLSTALQPTSGQIVINGDDVVADPLAMRKRIGFLSGTTSLYHRLTVRENVQYFGRLHGMNEDLLETEIKKVFDLLDIHSFADKKADSLSTGMKQRANIARTVIHQPEVIVLDEPTTGLDVISAKTILDFIESYKGSDVPVVFSTHHLHEVEKLCDRVVLINEGTTQFNGTLDDFRRVSGTGNLYDVFVKLVDEKEVA